MVHVGQMKFPERADDPPFDKIMRRRGGTAPREGDEMP